MNIHIHFESIVIIFKILFVGCLMDKKIFIERLNRLIKEKKLNNIKLAELIYKDSHTIARWRNGDSFPDFESLESLCKSLNCDLGYLIGDYDERNNDINFVCNYLKLSEKAINNIKDLKIYCEYGDYDFLNMILENPLFYKSVINDIVHSCSLASDFSEIENKKIKLKNTFSSGVINKSDYLQHKKQIDTIYNLSYKHLKSFIFSSSYTFTGIIEDIINNFIKLK